MQKRSGKASTLTMVCLLHLLSFQPQNYNITVSANPTQGGTVTGGGTYQEGQSCTVAASANTGYTFVNWTEGGNVVSTSANYTFTVNGNRTLVANFTQQNYTISVSANPTNGGTVTGGGTFHYGDNCTVSATPATGYTFLRWTENGNQVSTNASYSFSVTGNRTLVAQFQVQSYTISVSANPTNGGTVTGGGTYNYGASCTVTATPNQGYTFINWTENGTPVSTNGTYTFVVNQGRTLVANFEAEIIQIKVNIDPAESANISGEGTYQYGDQVVLTVEPFDNYRFLNWTEDGEVVSEATTYTFTATNDRTLTANLVSTVGVGENSGNKVTLYPNPVSDKLTVEAGEAINKVEIYNLVGTLVYSQKNCASKVEITTSDLQSGIYFIRLTTKSASETRRFIKE